MLGDGGEEGAGAGDGDGSLCSFDGLLFNEDTGKRDDKRPEESISTRKSKEEEEEEESMKGERIEQRHAQSTKSNHA